MPHACRILLNNAMITRRQILQSAAAPMIVPSLVLGQRAGAVPPSDAEVWVTGYRFGGGAIGNVGAGTLTVMKSSLPFIARGLVLKIALPAAAARRTASM